MNVSLGTKILLGLALVLFAGTSVGVQPNERELQHASSVAAPAIAPGAPATLLDSAPHASTTLGTSSAAPPAMDANQRVSPNAASAAPS